MRWDSFRVGDNSGVIAGRLESKCLVGPLLRVVHYTSECLQFAGEVRNLRQLETRLDLLG